LNVPGSLSSALQQMYFGFDELPLQSGGKAGAAAPAQPRRLDLLDEVVGLHRQRLAQPFVAAGALQVEVQRGRVRLADERCENGFKGHLVGGRAG